MFHFGLLLVFVRFSMLHEAIALFFGTHSYMMYYLGPPTLFGLLLVGGIQRTWQGRPTLYWLAFTGWMVVATIFSNWRGGSFVVLVTFLKSELPMLFLMAGLASTWKECRTLMYTLAAAGVFDLGIGRAYLRENEAGRISLDMGQGSLSNSNDFAGHLILILPFVLFVALKPRTWLFVRIIALIAVGLGLRLILGTGSRGALVGILVAFLFLLYRGTSLQRIVVLSLAPIAAIALVISLPSAVLSRLGSYGNDPNALEDAVGSAMTRSYLLRTSILYTFTHPLFGVGTGQFASTEGGLSRAEGKRGVWHETHNIYTQVSSENGIPALIFYLAALVSTFRLLSRNYRQARLRPQYQEVAVALLCIMVSLVGSCAAMFFLNMAYRFYLPAICGLSIAVSAAAQRMFASMDRDPNTPAGFPQRVGTS